MRGNAEYHHECDVNLQRAFIQHFCSHSLFGSHTGSLGAAQNSTLLVLRKRPGGNAL